MDLENRVTALELDMAIVKAEQRHLRESCASKEDLLSVKLELKEDIASLRFDLGGLRTDLHRMQADLLRTIDQQTWKMFGFFTVAISGVYYIARYVH